MPGQAFPGFDAFWLLYLREHASPRTRAIHVTGTVLAFLLLAVGLVTLDWRLLVATPVVGYGLAWLSHLLIEHNRPATFSHPLWSLRGDLRMAWLMLTGGLGPELRRAGVG